VISLSVRWFLLQAREMWLKFWTVTENSNGDSEKAWPRTTVPERGQNRRPGGLKWRRTILLGALFCSISLSITIAGTVIASRLTLNSLEIPLLGVEVRRFLFQGDYNDARKLKTLVQVGINLLSTILLSSSNYSMQCLSAPTRTELDKAHETGRWLDIGILSFRNLTQIKPVRTIIWLLLGASSLPLQLVYEDRDTRSIAGCLHPLQFQLCFTSP
jgi:hypothetical protein